MQEQQVVPIHVDVGPTMRSVAPRLGHPRSLQIAQADSACRATALAGHVSRALVVVQLPDDVAEGDRGEAVGGADCGADAAVHAGVHVDLELDVVARLVDRSVE